MRRKYLKSGVYLSMGIMVICLLFLLGKTPNLLNTMTELKQSPSNITIMLRTSVRMLSKVSGPSDKIKANTSSLLVNHYLIYMKPVGRLGNWLFQCASAFGIANTLRYQFCIEPSHPLNTFFDINYMCNLTISAMRNIKTLDEMECRNKTWTKNKSYLSYNLSINGFLQSWKYFDSVSREVRKMLSFKPNILLAARQIVENIKNKSQSIVTVGIHIRRGDFQWRPHQEMGYTIASTDYISKAMNFYRYKVRHALFIVVSDDMDWCRTNINGSDVRYSNSTEAITDLAVLSLCDHVIITGGTFGWWAGWLSGGTVVYLKDFPRPGSVLEKLTYNSQNDYYPTHWIGFGNS